MIEIIFESSERGDNLNWVKDTIISNELQLLAFEGYTVKENKVSLLIDRGLFKKSITEVQPLEIIQTLSSLPTFHFKAKCEFAKMLSVPFLFFGYSYENEICQVFELTSDRIDLLQTFNSFKDFGVWTKQYRDLVMLSQYEESGLPLLDQKMRASGTPWPGNLDYALLKTQKPIALIEFQRTAKASVKDHCNNTWFLPTPYRKGDVNRWLAIDIIRKQCGLPLYIIVWSTREKVVKLKLLDRIIYPNDTETPKGLIYKKKETMSVERLIEIFKKL